MGCELRVDAGAGWKKGKDKERVKSITEKESQHTLFVMEIDKFLFYFFLLCRRPYIISLWPPLNPLLHAWDLFPSAPYFTQAKMLFYITFN